MDRDYNSSRQIARKISCEENEGFHATRRRPYDQNVAVRHGSGTL
jgi:hypothetical protein